MHKTLLAKQARGLVFLFTSLIAGLFSISSAGAASVSLAPKTSLITQIEKQASARLQSDARIVKVGHRSKWRRHRFHRRHFKRRHFRHRYHSRRHYHSYYGRSRPCYKRHRSYRRGHWRHHRSPRLGIYINIGRFHHRRHHRHW